MLWLAKLVGLFFGSKSPIDALTETYVRYKDSVHEHEKLLAEDAKNQRDALIRSHQMAQEVRLATAGFWEMRLLTFLIALPFAIHLWLVFLDTVFLFPTWSVEKFPAPFDDWGGAILLSFFGIYTFGKVGMGFAAAIAARKAK